MNYIPCLSTDERRPEHVDWFHALGYNKCLSCKDQHQLDESQTQLRHYIQF